MPKEPSKSRKHNSRKFVETASRGYQGRLLSHGLTEMEMLKKALNTKPPMQK